MKNFEQKELLTKEEKEYLNVVIAPFKERIIHIEKGDFFGKAQYISIYHKDVGNKAYHLMLPRFVNDTMYKGMKLEKTYTLGELGL